MKTLRITTMLAAILFAAACGGDATGPVLPGPPAAMDVVAGNFQTDTVARELTEAIRVQVTDAEGVAVSGALVNFVVTEGDGYVFAGSALTNGEGIAREVWTLGTDAGTQELEARAVDQDTGEPIVYATVTATAIPDRPAAVTLSNRRVVLFVGERAALPRVAAVDRYGNEIDNPAVSWSVGTDTVHVERDSVWTDHEIRTAIMPSVVGQAVDAEVESLEILSLYNLGPVTYTVTYACRADWRADKDSVSVTLTVDSTAYDPVENGALSRTGRWYMSGEAIQWWADGTSDTIPVPEVDPRDGVTRTVMTWVQRAGEIGWFGGGHTTAVGTGAPPTYAGGTWCPHDGGSQYEMWSERAVLAVPGG